MAAMAAFSRFDRIVAAVLLAVLIGLVGLALATRSGAKSSAAAPAGSSHLVPAGSSSTTGPAPTTSPSTSSSTTATTTSSTSSTTTTTVAAGAPSPVSGQATAVGDSVMIDMQPNLQADIPGIAVDGAVSRQFETGIGVVQADRAAGTLGSVLVVELGTNGTVTSGDVDAMMQAAAGVKRVVFVNVDVPRSWEASDNATLAAGVARYPGVAVLADWYSLSSPHPEWFTADQVHLQPAGAAALAGLIAQSA
jgi:lysophospholipase L1-like esterase